MERIRLRAWREDDAERLVRIVAAAPDLERQLPSMPRSPEEAREVIRDGFRSGAEKFVWCIEVGTGTTGRAAGLVGISIDPETSVEAGPSGRGWVWYWAAAEARGTGIASAAVREACDWALADDGGGLRRLELGYRENNPASAGVAAAAGFRVEGRERAKFVVDGQLVDVLTAGRLATDDVPSRRRGHEVRLEDPRDPVPVPSPRLHHVELWTADFPGFVGPWRWLLTALGSRRLDSWKLGESWVLGDGSYLVLEQSPDVSGPHERTRAGLNHLALTIPARPALDRLRNEAGAHGWNELWPDRYPHAGGPDHVALYLENAEGFEVEIVAG